ncbi:MAG: hypothetical protein AMK72_07200, partial [Planctomycetes bacterium SM23_25]
RIHANPDEYADAGPVVGSGPRRPWGWTVEYDIDVPVGAAYTLQIRYAAAEARPVQVFVDNQNLTKSCTGATFGPAPSGQPVRFTWNSSGAKWEGARNQWGRLIGVSLTKGKHTVKLARRGPLPHLVALRLDTPAAFPDSWEPPRYKVRDFHSIPAAYRKAFLTPSDVDVAALRRPVKEAPGTRAAGSLEIPAWTFDRGNARIYASPDQYADAGPVVGSDPRRPEPGVVEYDIDFPAAGEYTLHVNYAAAEVRPIEVFLDGKSMGRCCTGITFGSAPFEIPVRFTWNSSGAVKTWEGLSEGGRLVRMSVTKGKHTLKLARRGPLPNLVALRLDSSAGFPKGWRPPRRKVRHLDSVPAAQRSVFLPPDAVNVAALRLAIEDMIQTLGPRYPGGPQYLKKLSELEARQSAAESGTPERKQEAEDALKSLRREAMLAHPALKFDKLLFVKRTPFVFNTYQDSKANTEGGGLYVLSPVSPDGKVTKLVPELDGGLFSRFDLSFDARKVAFGYKRKDKPFRIYEIDIDPSKGVMVPGSLRQLTFGSGEEAETIRRYGKQGCGIERGFDDMDPCYLPNGRIMFTSTRSMRRVFCNPSIVTSLHLMDADGRNMRCLSAGPLNEIDPCLLDDGRVVYTRWEYVDKGLGNGQSLWTVRPDGSGVDHVYKNSILRPAQLLNACSIPGSRRIVTVGAPHCGGRAGGPVILVDNLLTRRDPQAMTCITPEIAYPCMSQATWDMGFFREPYPFSEKFFLVSHSPGPRRRGAGYGIYVLDKWGNRAELYRDPKISCFQPTPLRPRRKPTDIASVEKVGAEQERTGTLFVQDVYQGMTGIERGRVKYLRVMGVLPWPWQENGVFRIGLAGNVHRKKVYGIAKVHEDGSACFTVPAEENLFFQALDENFMALQHMPTFINLRPGENRSCIGCHESRSKAPHYKLATAMRHPAQALSDQPGDQGPRMVHYEADVQPALDKHCVGCHSGGEPKGRLDLTGEPTTTWNRSYENLFGKGLVSYRDCRYGRSGFRPEPPLSFGSHLSELVDRIRRDPCKAELTRAEFVRIVTWIDANTPYYGTYRGKRDLQDKDHPDFRLPPVAAK